MAARHEQSSCLIILSAVWCAHTRGHHICTAHIFQPLPQTLTEQAGPNSRCKFSGRGRFLAAGADTHSHNSAEKNKHRYPPPITPPHRRRERHFAGVERAYWQNYPGFVAEKPDVLAPNLVSRVECGGGWMTGMC